MGAGVEFAGASELVVFIFDRDFKFRRLDIDGFNGFTDDTSNGVKNLASGLKLAFFNSLIEEFGTHVLQTREHIFAVSFPIFFVPIFNSFPVTPSGLDRDLFFFRMVINKCASGQSIQLTTI